MSAATKWTIVIVGLLATNMIAMVMLAVIARNGDNQVIPAYYEQSVHYDDAIDEATRSAALGWSASAALTAGSVEVLVRDLGGKALDGAQVHLAGYQRAHAADRIDVALAALGGGRYRAPLAAGRAGMHDLTITVERDGRRFTQRVVVEAN